MSTTSLDLGQKENLAKEQYVAKQQLNFFQQEVMGRIQFTVPILTLTLVPQIFKAAQKDPYALLHVIGESLLVIVLISSYFLSMSYPVAKQFCGELAFTTYTISISLLFILNHKTLFDESQFPVESGKGRVDLENEFAAFFYRISVLEAAIMMFCCIKERKRIIYRTAIRFAFCLPLILLVEISTAQKLILLVGQVVNRVICELGVFYVFTVLGRLFSKSENLQIANTQMNFLMKQTPLGAAIINLSHGQPKFQFINNQLNLQVQSWDLENNWFKKNRDQRLQNANSADFDFSASTKQIMLQYMQMKIFKRYSGSSFTRHDENKPNHSVLDLVMDPENKLNENWQTFYSPSPYGVQCFQGAILISICRKQIEFNGENCELVFIMDQNSQLKLMSKQNKINENLQEYRETLDETFKNLQQTFETCARMQESCRLDQLQSLKMMHACSTRLSLRVQDRIDRLKFEFQSAQHSQNLYKKLDMIEMVEETESMLKDVMDIRGLSLEIDVERDLPQTLYGDAMRIKQVLTNLIENSFLFSTNGSRISLKIKYRQSLEQLTVSIKNECMRMTEADKAKLFSRGCKLSNQNVAQSKGQGLGLYFSHLICKKLIRNGDINFVIKDLSLTTQTIKLTFVANVLAPSDNQLPIVKTKRDRQASDQQENSRESFNVSAQRLETPQMESENRQVEEKHS